MQRRRTPRGVILLPPPEGAAAVKQGPAIAVVECRCTFAVVFKGEVPLYATDTDCPVHGIFDRYDPAFAQKKGEGMKYTGLKYGY